MEKILILFVRHGIHMEIISDKKSKFRNVSFFCIEGGTGGSITFESMAKLCEKEPIIHIRNYKKVS